MILGTFVKELKNGNGGERGVNIFLSDDTGQTYGHVERGTPRAHLVYAVPLA
jgi:hypothetical protein